MAGAQRDRRDGYVCVGGFTHSRPWRVTVPPPPDAEGFVYVVNFSPVWIGSPQRSHIMRGLLVALVTMRATAGRPAGMADWCRHCRRDSGRSD